MKAMTNSERMGGGGDDFGIHILKRKQSVLSDEPATSISRGQILEEMRR
jgi:hypothetical protein